MFIQHMALSLGMAIENHNVGKEQKRLQFSILQFKNRILIFLLSKNKITKDRCERKQERKGENGLGSSVGRHPGL